MDKIGPYLIFEIVTDVFHWFFGFGFLILDLAFGFGFFISVLDLGFKMLMFDRNLNSPRYCQIPNIGFDWLRFGFEIGYGRGFKFSYVLSYWILFWFWFEGHVLCNYV